MDKFLIGQNLSHKNNQMNVTRFLKRYLIWLALLSIPFWNYFNVVFSQMNVPEEESVATGTVIIVFIGAFIGRYLAMNTFRKTTEFPYYAALAWVAIFLVDLFFILILMKIKFKDDGIGVFLFAIGFLIMSVLCGFVIKATTIIIGNNSRETERIILKSENELKLLQSQLSPHFLFNTLNNLYSLSLIKDDKLPGLLLKLSELLRYSVYQTGDAFVPLTDELAYIKNYIEFEKIRLDSRLSLNVNLEENPEIKIAPMLLIVFIENAFKHSKNTSSDKIMVDIKLKIWENSILFSVSNSYEKEKQNTLNKSSGLGLENAKRRLELLYPNRYDLKIEDDGQMYKLMLQLK